jgi:hypothetical protein
MKITTFKPTTQNPMTKFNKPTTQNPMTKFNKPTIQNPISQVISQVTNDPDIDEYATDIW